MWLCLAREKTFGKLMQILIFNEKKIQRHKWVETPNPQNKIPFTHY